MMNRPVRVRFSLGSERSPVFVDPGALNASDPFVEEIVQAAVGPCRGDDLLYVQHESSDTARVILVQHLGDDGWSLDTWSAQRGEPDIRWTRTDAKADQATALQDAYDDFAKWIGAGLALCEQDGPRFGSLVVKVDPQSRWLLRFPLTTFHQLGFAGFAMYRDVEWITSEKSFSTHGCERAQIRQELCDVETVLTRTVIFINTYKEHSRDPKCASGTEAMVAILSLFRDVALGAASHSLRWYLNPSVEKVREILLDPRTAYVFADFEASAGFWESGEGTAASWDRTESAVATRAPIEFGFDPKSLRHVRLMRLFHCNSIFTPF